MVQLQIQKIIVQKKLSSQEAIKEVSQATSTKFCDYHSFLKDLTPLWFKGSLCDVLMVSLNSFKEDDINVICQNLISGINVLNEVNVKKIMEENFSFLKIIYNSQKTIKLDFNKFLLELIPDMNEFIRQYELGRKELIDLLKLIQTQRNVWYLGQYTYMGSKANQNNFLDRKNVPPWEGRWDTLKPPIEEGEKTEFLVEHRNN